MDESEITTYPNEKQITAYLRNLRSALQGADFIDNADQRKSEYRISTVYELSETEKNVVRDLERRRLERETDEIDSTPVTVRTEPMKTAEGKVTSKFRMTSQTSVEDGKPMIIERSDEPRPLGRSRRDSIKELDDHQAELQKMTE